MSNMKHHTSIHIYTYTNVFVLLSESHFYLYEYKHIHTINQFSYDQKLKLQIYQNIG